MASEKQLVANRANAKRSTGPKTAAGKAQSSMNACEHGLTARKIVIPGEDPKKFDRLRAELWDEWQPRLGMQSILVDRLAGQIWRLLRAPVFEAAIIEARCAHYTVGEALIWDSQYGDTLGKLSRYEAALMNDCAKTMQMLVALQSRRAGRSMPTQSLKRLPLWQTLRMLHRNNWVRFVIWKLHNFEIVGLIVLRTWRPTTAQAPAHRAQTQSGWRVADERRPQS